MKPTPEQWNQIKETVADAFELPAQERDAFIEAAFQDDTFLLSEAQSLLSFRQTNVRPELKPRHLAPGTILNGRYLVDHPLAEGGFAIAWLALDQQLSNRPVVVKLFTGDRFDPYIRRKFADELRALSALAHPNIIAPLDSGETTDGTPFIVTEYAEGETLGAILGRERLPLPRAAHLLAQIGHTLAFIHARGVIHRDLKPENIIVQRFGEKNEHVRLIDFGIATVASSKEATTTRIIGSLVYMAPEQLNGIVLTATDTYAFGVLAYEMVTGVVPFPADGPDDLLRRQDKGPVRPSAMRPEISRVVDAMILSALDTDPERRPLDPAALADQLAGALLEGAPALAQRRWRRLSFGIAALLLCTLLSAFFVYLQKTSRHEAIAVQPTTARIAPAPIVAAAIRLERHVPQGLVTPGPLGEIVMRSGDEFRLQLNSEMPGHLYLFAEEEGTVGIHILFPSPTAHGATSFLGKGEALLVPEHTWFRIGSKNTANSGRDVLEFVWSPDALPVLEQTVRFANTHDRGAVLDDLERASIRGMIQRNAQALQARDLGWQLYSAAPGRYSVGRIQISHPEKTPGQLVMPTHASTLSLSEVNSL